MAIVVEELRELAQLEAAFAGIELTTEIEIRFFEHAFSALKEMDPPESFDDIMTLFGIKMDIFNEIQLLKLKLRFPELMG